METLNIAYKKSYKKNGEEFTQWIQVGKLFKHEDGGMTINLNSIPVEFNGNLSVFVNKKKEVKVNTGAQPREEIQEQEIPTIKQEEIPF